MGDRIKMLKALQSPKQRQNFSVATPDTQIFDISKSKAREVSIKLIFKNNIENIDINLKDREL